MGARRLHVSAVCVGGRRDSWLALGPSSAPHLDSGLHHALAAAPGHDLGCLVTGTPRSTRKRTTGGRWRRPWPTASSLPVRAVKQRRQERRAGVQPLPLSLCVRLTTCACVPVRVRACVVACRRGVQHGPQPVRARRHGLGADCHRLAAAGAQAAGARTPLSAPRHVREGCSGLLSGRAAAARARDAARSPDPAVALRQVLRARGFAEVARLLTQASKQASAHHTRARSVWARWPCSGHPGAWSLSVCAPPARTHRGLAG